MKGLFIYYKDISKSKVSGIDKKVKSQINVFNQEKLNFSFSINSSSGGAIEKLLYRFPFFNTFQKWEYKNEYDNIDYLYLRRPAAFTKYTINVLKLIKKRNPSIKIVLEIPTYPYDKELTINKKNIPLLIKDRHNRKKLAGIVDRIATLTGDKELFDIPTLKFENGVDLSSISMKKPTVKNGTVNLIAVAMYAEWHGYDRILESIGQYYSSGGKREVVFHLVGNGSETQKYKTIVKKYNIEKNVIFYGEMSGEELDRVYDKSDIAVDVFGMYRKNNTISYSLKSREYLAKGLPIISGCKIDLFENHNIKYFKEFSNDSSKVPLESIFDFYDDIYSQEKSPLEIITEIREFAEKTCGMNSAMKNVTDYFKEKI
ncbi:glycosyltransferase [Planococcus versutus]|uniref:Glycosyl transferase family 1 domain-containing protein n=1 Tax=Planococcus versutus TaxID=1302659 RepID=A0A1B1S323_9BACL|nr:glycosyltransferase [Planococcus versutus]ANU27549.1 hypothetical protein I858_011175 [Planococcus versutus]